MCNGPDHMFQDHNLKAKSHNRKNYVRGNLALSVFGETMVRSNRDSERPLTLYRSQWVDAIPLLLSFQLPSYQISAWWHALKHCEMHSRTNKQTNRQAKEKSVFFFLFLSFFFPFLHHNCFVAKSKDRNEFEIKASDNQVSFPCYGMISHIKIKKIDLLNR